MAEWLHGERCWLKPATYIISLWPKQSDILKCNDSPDYTATAERIKWCCFWLLGLLFMSCIQFLILTRYTKCKVEYCYFHSLEILPDSPIHQKWKGLQAMFYFFDCLFLFLFFQIVSRVCLFCISLYHPWKSNSNPKRLILSTDIKKNEECQHI